jgi:hypothetical protein
MSNPKNLTATRLVKNAIARMHVFNYHSTTLVSSVQKIMLELAKIRLIGLGNNRTVVTGLNPRQHEILESLKWQVDLQA